MRQLNNSRINEAYQFIKNFYVENNECPSFRQIQIALNYKSLSLVSSDIKHLCEKGLLTKNNRNKIQLVEFLKNSKTHPDFPLLAWTSAPNSKELLFDEEKRLLEAQNNYLQGNYLLASKQALEILDNNPSNFVKLGARLTLCSCSLYTGETKYWKETFKSLLSLDLDEQFSDMEKELLLHFLSLSLGSRKNCPQWLKDGKFYGLSKGAYPLARICFISEMINEKKSLPIELMEPYCAQADLDKIETAQVYSHLLLTKLCNLNGENKMISFHLKMAVNICIKNEWITPLAELEKPLGTILSDYLKENYETVYKKVESLRKLMEKNYSTLITSIVGDDPTSTLTLREAEIATFVKQGLSNKEIANKLFLSTHTIKHYLSIIYSKKSISNRHELVELLKE